MEEGYLALRYNFRLGENHTGRQIIVWCWVFDVGCFVFRKLNVVACFACFILAALELLFSSLRSFASLRSGFFCFALVGPFFAP